MLRRKPKEKKGSKNEMKKTLCVIIGIIAAIAMLAGCAAETTTPEDTTAPVETAAATDTTTTDDATTTTDDAATTTDDAAATTTEDTTTTEEVVYVGEYSDNDGTDCKLEIAANEEEEGKYVVQVSIYRLTDLSDGVGEVTEEGLTFTATDAAGNPITGVITLDGEKATVTFTESTWSNIANGDTFEYTKTSDTPTIVTAE